MTSHELWPLAAHPTPLQSRQALPCLAELRVSSSQACHYSRGHYYPLILLSKSARAVLKFEPSNECTFLRVKIARDMQERVERCRAFRGALELADLVDRALVYVMDQDADCRAQEKEGAASPGRGHAWSVKWVSPADKTGGAP